MLHLLKSLYLPHLSIINAWKTCAACLNHCICHTWLLKCIGDTLCLPKSLYLPYLNIINALEICDACLSHYNIAPNKHQYTVALLKENAMFLSLFLEIIVPLFPSQSVSAEHILLLGPYMPGAYQSDPIHPSILHLDSCSLNNTFESFNLMQITLHFLATIILGI